MTCYHPVSGHFSVNYETGKKSFTKNHPTPWKAEAVTFACGQCVGCRLKKAKEWAIRCTHEASLHEENMFVTFTYNNENLPGDHSLDKTHFQKFLKRYRKYLEKYKTKIRYYHCGEYGEASENNDWIARPHYHALIFGHLFSDIQLHKQNRHGQKLYTSKTLNRLWGKGYCLIGAVTFESAGYVARYCMKKQTGKGAADHYSDIDEETGELITRQPEYASMSLKPAIGRDWYEKYKADVFPLDEVVLNGTKNAVPKYYSTLLSRSDPEQYEQIRLARIEFAQDASKSITPERNQQREKHRLAVTKTLKRELQ